MAEDTCFAQVRGSVIRVTRLDAVGDIDPGASAVVTSKRISTVSIDEVTEEGTNIREMNFGGEVCIDDEAQTQVLGYTADITLCGVDPNLITLLTGQPLVRNAYGEVVGFDATTGIDLDDFGFALEVWSKIAGNQRDARGNRLWGYTPFPFLKGGRLGGFSFENGAVQFTITGARTRDNNGWGRGPFDVDLDASGNPSPLHETIGPKTHYRNIVVSLAPPAAACGAFPLASI